MGTLSRFVYKGFNVNVTRVGTNGQYTAWATRYVSFRHIALDKHYSGRGCKALCSDLIKAKIDKECG